LLPSTCVSRVAYIDRASGLPRENEINSGDRLLTVKEKSDEGQTSSPGRPTRSLQFRIKLEEILVEDGEKNDRLELPKSEILGSQIIRHVGENI